ncbi:9099_t:CDS:2, partial [Racocetra fulgida]
MAEMIGKPFIQDLTNVLWYIDGCNSNTFTQRYNLLKVFEDFMGYNNPQHYKYLSKYAEYLAYKHIETSQNQEFNQSIINEYDNGELKIFKANDKYKLENIIKYRNLSLALQDKQYWQPILADNFCSSISHLKKGIIKSLQPTKIIMQDIFERLKLKGESFSIFESVTEQEIEYLWKSVLEIDDLLVPKNTSRKHIENKIKNFLKNFIETIDYTCGIMFYRISDLTKASSLLDLNDNNQAISINTNDDSDNNIDSMEDNTNESPVEQSDESPVEQSDKSPVEQPDESPVEQPNESPVEQPNESSVEQNMNNDLLSLETLFKH